MADSFPPSEACGGDCDAWRDLKARRRWQIPIVVALLGALVAVGVPAVQGCSRSVETRVRVDTMAESQTRAAEERQRLAAEQARSARETAQTLTEINRTLARIEALVEQQQERERARERRPRPRRRR